MSGELSRCFEFIQQCFLRVPDREIDVQGAEPLAIVYSDAACDSLGIITYGWVVKIEGSQPPAGYGTVPGSVACQFQDRANQIMAGELLGALLAIFTCGPRLKGCRVLHFVDNQGALASLISGGHCGA